VKRKGPCLETYLEAGQNPYLFLNMIRFHFMTEDFQTKDLLSGWQNWKLTFISTRFLIKVGLVTCKLFYGVRELWFEFLDFRTCICKLFYGVRELWFEFLDFRTCIDTSLIQSWQDLRQSLILKFIQDDYEEILY